MTTYTIVNIDGETKVMTDNFRKCVRTYGMEADPRLVQIIYNMGDLNKADHWVESLGNKVIKG